MGEKLIPTRDSGETKFTSYRQSWYYPGLSRAFTYLNTMWFQLDTPLAAGRVGSIYNYHLSPITPETSYLP